MPNFNLPSIKWCHTILNVLGTLKAPFNRITVMYAFSQPGGQKNKTESMALNMLPVEYFTSQLLTQVRQNKWRMSNLNR